MRATDPNPASSATSEEKAGDINLPADDLTIQQLMHTEFGVELSAKKTGKAYVAGSGTGQPHLKDAVLVSLETAPSSKRSADEPDEKEGPSTKRARTEEAAPEARASKKPRADPPSDDKYHEVEDEDKGKGEEVEPDEGEDEDKGEEAEPDDGDSEYEEVPEGCGDEEED